VRPQSPHQRVSAAILFPRVSQCHLRMPVKPMSLPYDTQPDADDPYWVKGTPSPPKEASEILQALFLFLYQLKSLRCFTIDPVVFVFLFEQHHCHCTIVSVSLYQPYGFDKR